MTSIANIALQLWFSIIQKFFLIPKKALFPSKNFELKSNSSNTNFSRVFRKLKKRIKKQVKNSKTLNNKISFELYSNLMNEKHYLITTKFLRTLKRSRITALRKNLSKTFCNNSFNFIREKLLYQWVNKFFQRRDLCLKFFAAINQSLENYFSKFLNKYFIVILQWSIISKKPEILNFPYKKCFVDEVVKFSCRENNISLQGEFFKTFFAFIKNFQINRKEWQTRKNRKIITRFFIYIGIKLWVNFPAEKISNKSNFKEIFFQDMFTTSIFFKGASKKLKFSSLFFGNKKNLINLLKINKNFKKFFFMVSESSSLVEFLPKFSYNNLIPLIFDLLGKFEKEIYYRFTFLSTIKNFDFKLIALKLFSKNKVYEFFEKIILLYWKTICFFQYNRFFVNRDEMSFQSLESQIQIKHLFLENKLKIRVQKYLLNIYHSLAQGTVPNLLVNNVFYQIRLYSFWKMAYNFNFLDDIFKFFYFTIAIVVINLNFNIYLPLFSEILFLLDKMLFVKDTMQCFGEKLKKCIKLCKNICMNITCARKIFSHIKYKFGILKICEEINSVAEEPLKLVKINLRPSGLLYEMQNFLHKHNSEFIRDAYSHYFLKTNIKLYPVKILGKSNEEYQFLPIKILRVMRTFSRFYFIKNLREKQLIWNYETIKLLIHGSATYCFEKVSYFIQVGYDEMLFFLSFNRSNFIFESEYDYLFQNFKANQRKVYKAIRKKKFINILKKGSLSSERFYLLEPSFLLNYHLYKTNGVKKIIKKKINPIKNNNVSGDYICVTEAIIMKILKMRQKVKSASLILIIKGKLCSLFKADPRGILIQAKHLNNREYLNFFPGKNFFTYL